MSLLDPRSLLDPAGESLFEPHSSAPAIAPPRAGLKGRKLQDGLTGSLVPRLSPRDMIDLLFRHRTKARMAAMPRVRISLSVFTPSGRPAVQMSL